MPHAEKDTVNGEMTHLTNGEKPHSKVLSVCIHSSALDEGQRHAVSCAKIERLGVGFFGEISAKSFNASILCELYHRNDSECRLSWLRTNEGENRIAFYDEYTTEIRRRRKVSRNVRILSSRLNKVEPNFEYYFSEV